MTDSSLRKLVRSAAASDDVEVEASLLRERVRAGDLLPDRLVMAAHVGHTAAIMASGLAQEDWLTARAAALAGLAPRDVTDWALANAGRACVGVSGELAGHARAVLSIIHTLRCGPWPDGAISAEAIGKAVAAAKAELRELLREGPWPKDHEVACSCVQHALAVTGGESEATLAIAEASDRPGDEQLASHVESWSESLVENAMSCAREAANVGGRERRTAEHMLQRYELVRALLA
jgi:hypothetical protein